MTDGYSGTPLAKKLSLKDGMRVWQEGMPESVIAEILSAGLQLQHLPRPEAPIDGAHIFVTDCAALDCELHIELRPRTVPRDGSSP